MGKTWTRDNISGATADEKTGMDWVYAGQFFRNQDKAAQFKREETANYLELFDRYAWSMDNRPGTAGSPPAPAYAQIVTGDITGWSELAQSPTERVCETKVYKPTPKPEPGEGKIGKRMFEGDDEFFNILPGDITPNFKKIPGTSADGVFGVFQKHANIQGGPGQQANEIPGVFIRLKPQSGV